jgi:acetoin utilization deacetylase AcuC-like enzyme
MRRLIITAVNLSAAILLISSGALQGVAASQRGGTTPPAPQTGFVFDELYRRHLVGDAGHPERPERLTAVLGGLEKAGVLNALTRIPARPATDDELALAHDRSYVELVKRELANVEGVKQLSTGDTDVTRESLAAARAAAGGVLNAADAVASGRMKNAFCAVRPRPEQARASGRR